MDDAVQRFRRQAGRELGDRQGAERRYSDGLRQEAVAYWRARASAGDGVRAVASALGVAPVSLRRWAQDSRFRPVRLIGDAAPVAARLGVDVDTAAQLIARLR
jgi:transposase-like protein